MGLGALLVLVGGAVFALIHATQRNEARLGARERQAVAAAFDARRAEMTRALAGLVWGRQDAFIADIAQQRFDALDARIGHPLGDGFGFEYVYVVDRTGTPLYASENGRRGATQAFEWIRPAVMRALEASGERQDAGLVVAPHAAGLMAAQPLATGDAAVPSQSAARGPLLLVAVDRIDEDFFADVFGPASHVRLAREDAGSPPDGVSLANLADGSKVRLSVARTPASFAILAEVLPILAVAATVLCLVFFALMLRARRVAAALAVSEARARTLAYQDALTGLANRPQFIAELERALETASPDEPVALVFIDLDGFKEINDSLGHAVGDDLLCVVARRLRGCLGERGLVARFGGDEFVLFIHQNGGEEGGEDGDEAALARFVATLFGVLDMPIPAGGNELSISASMGAARAPMDARASGELMRLADIALYRAKAEGRGAYRLFEARFEHERLERRRIEVELAAALEKGEIKLAFQPQVDVESERIVGFEILARWDHPTRGHLLPGAFIPVAESARLISRLDSYVLRTACKEARALPGVTISVNMSPAGMRHARMVDDILATLRETEFDPRRLEIEITESAILDASAEGQEALVRLRDLGVRLALDDFGTGHASLVHVRRFPITKIKIDKSFILNLGVQRDAAAIVEYVVRLGRSLGITLTAEGVETREQLRFLRTFGAHQAQGYLFSPPVPLAGAVALLERQREQERQHAARALPGEAPAKPEVPDP